MAKFGAFTKADALARIKSQEILTDALQAADHDPMAAYEMGGSHLAADNLSAALGSIFPARLRKDIFPKKRKK